LFSVGNSVNWKARGKGENDSKHKSFLGLTHEEHEGSQNYFLPTNAPFIKNTKC